VLTFRLCVVHSLPSAIRLEESVVPDAFWFCAESRSKEAITDPNAILSAIGTTQTRIVLVLSLTLVMNDLPPRTEPFYTTPPIAPPAPRMVTIVVWYLD
jgi:hypothetical protein